jgi:hypothetical protein
MDNDQKHNYFNNITSSQTSEIIFHSLPDLRISERTVAHNLCWAHNSVTKKRFPVTEQKHYYEILQMKPLISLLSRRGEKDISVTGREGP